MPNELLELISESDPKRQEIVERYKYASEHFASWNTEAKEDYEFALGDQWTDEDRQALKDQARPCLTFNRIRPIINIVSGYQRENSARIKVNPEGGEDRIFSEVMDRAIKFVEKISHLNHKMGYWFDDGCYCGKGWLEGIITYDKDPIRGELQFKQRTPYQILPDPDFKEYDLNDGCRYCFKVVKLTKAELLDLYPGKKTVIENLDNDTSDDPTQTIVGGVLLEGDSDDYGNKSALTTITQEGGSEDDEESEFDNDEKFTVKEYWHLKMVDKFFVIEKDNGEPRRFDKKEEAEVFITSQGFGKIIERKVPEMHVSALCAGWLLQDDKLSPFEPYYSGYSFFRFMADWAPNSEDEVLRVQGITRPLKDPQREKNKAKSQNLHILNTQANSGWVIDDNALTPEGSKKLEEMGAKPGIVIKKKPGSEVREILPKGPNAGMIQREEKADEEFKQVIGVNPDLLGLQENTASGRAIGLRIKQAVLSLTRLFANYRYSKEIIGKFILEMVPMLFDEKKLIKIIGPQYMGKALDPEKYPEGLKDGHIAAFLTMVKDNKYDVFVAEADQNATMRYEIFQELTELLKAGAPIPMDLLVDYMDLPNSEEVKQKIKQQQQMQMQMAAAQGAAKGTPGA